MKVGQAHQFKDLQRENARLKRAVANLTLDKLILEEAAKVRSDEAALRTDVVRLASRFGRYGYRQITNLLRIEGWQVNHKRVERIWRQEGLKVPRRHPKRGRLWLNDGSEYPHPAKVSRCDLIAVCRHDLGVLVVQLEQDSVDNTG